MCWRLRTTAERSTLGHMYNQLDFFSKCGWTLPPDLRVQLKYDPFIGHNLREGSTCGKYEFKRAQQTKLTPTSECYSLDVLETVNTRAFGHNRDDVLPEDLWPNLNAMVMKLQEMYIGSHEEIFERSTTRIRLRFLGWFSKHSHGDVVPGTRETTVDDVRPKPVCDVAHLRWCGDLVTQDFLRRTCSPHSGERT